MVNHPRALLDRALAGLGIQLEGLHLRIDLNRPKRVPVGGCGVDLPRFSDVHRDSRSVKREASPGVQHDHAF